MRWSKEKDTLQNKICYIKTKWKGKEAQSQKRQVISLEAISNKCPLEYHAAWSAIIEEKDRSADSWAIVTSKCSENFGQRNDIPPFMHRVDRAL